MSTFCCLTQKRTGGSKTSESASTTDNFRKVRKTESHFRGEQAKFANDDAVTAVSLALEGIKHPTMQAGDVVITAKLDRAFRSAADALGTLEQLKADKVALHMIDLGGDVTGNGISKLVFTILSAVAENERDRIRERVRDVKQHRASQRLFNGGKRPFGFNVEGEGKDRRLVPNAAEQAALTRGRALQTEGKSLREIAAIWSEEFGLAKIDAKSVKRILERAA
ncbi:putative DNA-invertase from lambdoid prophage Rac [Bradyrhizobium sp. S3.9.2]|uniref:recombinase family protein n=1 Tax=Bradyrhizobium sp. S3.9.2 TaxID=3156432 RepID=UPI003394D032